MAQRVADQAAAASAQQNWTAAAAQWQKAADQYRLLNDLPGLAVAYHNTGQAHAHLEQWDQAAAALNRAAALNEQLGRHDGWWRDQIALLQLEALTTNSSSLDQRLQQLEPRLNEVGDQATRGMFFNELGLRQIQQEKFDLALQSFDLAGRAFAAARDNAGLATVQANRGYLDEARLQFADAERNWRQALEQFELLAEPLGITRCLAGLGRSILQQGNNFVAAADYLQRAQMNYTNLGRPSDAARMSDLLEQARAGASTSRPER